MKLFIKKVEGLKCPAQANQDDAGYDVIATSGPVIHGVSMERLMDGRKLWKRVAFIEYGTNLFVEPQWELQVQWRRTPPPAKETTIHQEIRWDTIGVKYHTQIWPRSSISKTNLILANSIGLIDYGYRNQISVRFKYIFQPEDLTLGPEGFPTFYGLVNDEHLYHLGDRIVQITAAPNVQIDFEIVEELGSSQRDLKGFGSSGR